MRFQFPLMPQVAVSGIRIAFSLAVRRDLAWVPVLAANRENL